MEKFESADLSELFPFPAITISNLGGVRLSDSRIYMLNLWIRALRSTAEIFRRWKPHYPRHLLLTNCRTQVCSLWFLDICSISRLEITVLIEEKQ